MPTWTRPYQQRSRTLSLVTAGVVTAVLLVCFWPIPLDGSAIPWGGVLCVGLYLGAVLTALWRWVLRGVFVSDDGIKIRSVLRTTLIPWRHIKAIGVVDVSAYRNRALVVATRSGREFRTLLWEFTGERFGRARVPVTGIALPTAELESVAATLNARAPDADADES